MTTQTAATLILLVLFLFLVSNHAHARILPKHDNTTDMQSLLSFKSHIVDDPFGVLQNWNTNTSFCNWRGVTCNKAGQRVTSLSLPHANLAGTISPHISNLSFLSRLDLRSNSISGMLPPELGRLFRLTHLILTCNFIQGIIPSSLGELRELQLLILGKNNLTGEIPPSLGNFSSMTTLVLSYNSLQGSIPKLNLPKLSFLAIEHTDVSGEIPPSLFNSSSLIVLSLVDNRLSGSLPSDLFLKLPNLTEFYVGANSFTGPLPSSLANASQLIRLDLGENSFTGQIPSLSDMPNLQWLSLEDNQLTSDGEGGLDFISSLANSPHLQILSLSGNRLTGNLPPSIGNLSKELSQLYLGDNKLEGSLPQEISKLAGLISLDLGYNSFTGNIPRSVGKMAKLQRLFLNNNKLSGDIPDNLWNLSYLFDLALSQNNLTGAIPASIGNLQHLQIIDLSANMLSGQIPKEIFSIPSLSSDLNLSSNLLTGSLPVDIGNMKALQVLDISKNYLTGEIPLSVGDCSNLIVLDFSKNSFEGFVPSSLGNLKSIVNLSISSNKLSGRIPSSLKSLKYIHTLDLSMNQLEGDVPTEGIFANYSVVSLDGNPNLCGGILVFKLPKCAIPKKHSGGTKIRLIVGIVVVVTTLSTLSCVFFICLWKRNTSKPKVNDDIISFEGPHRLYTYHDLRIATANFDSNNLIGEGSFGRVYKGILSDGTPAAIKVFDLKQHGALKSFLSECEAFRNVRHRNLVRIISACSSTDFKALVLQFISNGTLDQWLHKASRSFLDFSTRHRLEVAKDVAVALEYLHHDCEIQVVHCDLKPSNVLLDENMVAYVGDFGLARMVSKIAQEVPRSSTLALKGSIGYIPPEYAMSGVSPKGDVYSYGIILLEMCTGKKPTDEMFTEEFDLQSWVTMSLPDHIMDIIDPELAVDIIDSTKISLVSALNIGLSCASKSPHERPAMRDVASMIKDLISEER